MGRLSMATRKELTAVAAERYRTSDHPEKTQILDEFVDITGYHRKHAMRLLRGDVGAQIGRRKRRRIYDEAERNALVLLWEASDRVCGKRLKALMPVLIEAMERHGHLELAVEIRAKLLAMARRRLTGRWRGYVKAWGAVGDGLRRTHCEAVFRYGRRRIGAIHRPGLSRRTSSPTVFHRRAAASSRPWCSPTLQQAGRNALR